MSNSNNQVMKSEQAVAERRLRPIYDYLDNNNCKKALQEAEKVLKKQPNLLCAKALKALAQLRLGRTKECTDIMKSVRSEPLLDDTTLQAMSMCYRELNCLNEICELYEEAISKDATNEEYHTHLFMAYVRVGDWKKQQQVALNLYKIFPKMPYYCWAVMSVVMQARSSPPEVAEKVMLPLAERMVIKCVSENKIDSEQEMQLYILILEMQNKFEEALTVLDSIGENRVNVYDYKYRRIGLLEKMKNWRELNIYLKKLIINELDSYSYYCKYIDSVIEIINEKGGNSELKCLLSLSNDTPVASKDTPSASKDTSLSSEDTPLTSKDSHEKLQRVNTTPPVTSKDMAPASEVTPSTSKEVPVATEGMPAILEDEKVATEESESKSVEMPVASEKILAESEKMPVSSVEVPAQSVKMPGTTLEEMLATSEKTPVRSDDMPVTSPEALVALEDAPGTSKEMLALSEPITSENTSENSLVAAKDIILSENTSKVRKDTPIVLNDALYARGAGPSMLKNTPNRVLDSSKDLSKTEKDMQGLPKNGIHWKGMPVTTQDTQVIWNYISDTLRDMLDKSENTFGISRDTPTILEDSIVSSGDTSQSMPGTSSSDDTPSTSKDTLATVKNEPIVSKETPKMLPDEPGTSKGKALSSQKKLGTSKDKPGTSKGKPGKSRDKPGTSQCKPGSLRDEPGTSQHKSGTWQEEPGTSQCKPGKSQDKPATSQNKSEILREKPKRRSISLKDVRDAVNGLLNEAVSIPKAQMLPDDSIEACLTFIVTCQEENLRLGSKMRGPFLAPLILAKKLEELGLNTKCILGDIVTYFVRYFMEFGHKGCLMRDISQYIYLVKDKKRLLRAVQENIDLTLTVDQLSEIGMSRYLTYYQLKRFLELPEKQRFEDKIDLVSKLFMYYNGGKLLFPEISRTEFGVCDGFLVLASHVLYEIYVDKRDFIFLKQALALLEHAIVLSPANYNFKMLLSRFYNILGATECGYKYYERLDIKNTQLDALGYMQLWPLISTGQYTRAKSMMDVTRKFFTSNYNEAMDQLTYAYKYGAFAKVPEFMDFQKRLSNSFFNHMNTVESIMCEIYDSENHESLLAEAARMNIGPTRRSQLYTWGSKLIDNRDFSSFAFHSPPGKQLNKKHIKLSMENDTLYLRIRTLMIQCLGACIDMDPNIQLPRHPLKNISGLGNGSDNDDNKQDMERKENLSRLFHIIAEISDIYTDILLSRPQLIPNYVLSGIENTRIITYERIGDDFISLFVNLMWFAHAFGSHYYVNMDGDFEIIVKAELVANTFIDLMNDLMTDMKVETESEAYGTQRYLLHRMTLVTELVSAMAVVCGVFDSMLRAKTKHLLPESKKKKKKSEPRIVEEIPDPVNETVINVYRHFLSNMRQIIGKFESALSKMINNAWMEMEEELDPLFCTTVLCKVGRDIVPDNSFLGIMPDEWKLLLRKVNENITNSYRSSVTEMRNIVGKKVQYMSILHL